MQNYIKLNIYRQLRSIDFQYLCVAWCHTVSMGIVGSGSTCSGFTSNTCCSLKFVGPQIIKFFLKSSFGRGDRSVCFIQCRTNCIQSLFLSQKHFDKLSLYMTLNQCQRIIMKCHFVRTYLAVQPKNLIKEKLKWQAMATQILDDFKCSAVDFVGCTHGFRIKTNSIIFGVIMGLREINQTKSCKVIIKVMSLLTFE